MRITLLALLAVLLIGCGGGGGSQPTSNPKQTLTITVPPEADSSHEVAGLNLNIQANSFSKTEQLEVEIWSPTDYQIPSLLARNESSGIRLTAQNTPLKDLTVTFPTPSDGIAVPVIATESGWQELKSTTHAGQISATIPRHLVALRDRAAPVVILGLVALVVFPTASEVDTETGLLLVAGSGAVGQGSVILVHGFNDHADSFRLLGERLVSSGAYRNAYSFQYDWRLDGVTAALELANHLRPLRPVGKSVDIVAHSFGGTIARYTLEILGESHAIRNAVFVCSPHKGAIAAEVSEILRILRHDFINQPGTPHNYRGFPQLDSPSLGSLRNSSSFIESLSRPSGQRAHTSYLLVTGLNDLVVPRSSSRAEGIKLEEQTAGTVKRVDENVNHSELVKGSAGIARFLNLLAQHLPPTSTGVTLELVPHEVEIDWTGNWNWGVVVRNNTGNTITLKTLTFDSFDKNGEWLGATWYESGLATDEFFLPEYREWNATLGPGREVELYIRDVPDRNKHTGLAIWEVPEHMRARSLEHTLTYSAPGNERQVVTMLTEYYQDLWPSPAKTRSPRNGSKPLGIGQTRPPVFR